MYHNNKIFPKDYGLFTSPLLPVICWYYSFLFLIDKQILSLNGFNKFF